MVVAVVAVEQEVAGLRGKEGEAGRSWGSRNLSPIYLLPQVRVSPDRQPSIVLGFHSKEKPPDGLTDFGSNSL